MNVAGALLMVLPDISMLNGCRDKNNDTCMHKNMITSTKMYTSIPIYPHAHTLGNNNDW